MADNSGVGFSMGVLIGVLVIVLVLVVVLGVAPFGNEGRPILDVRLFR